MKMICGISLVNGRRPTLMAYRFLFAALIGLLFPEDLIAQQFDLKNELHCVSRKEIKNREISKSDLFPKKYFDWSKIDLDIKQTSNQAFRTNFPDTKSKAYKPNLKYLESYLKVLQDNDSCYGTLTHFETCVTLGSDLVIKGKVLKRDSYSDTCLMYKSTYQLLILDIYKNNFDYKVGDTIVLKSVVGKEGGCAELEWTKQLEPTWLGYEHAMEIGEDNVFALSALWYYRVTASNAVFDSKSKDPVCLGYFVDPGFNLTNVSNNPFKIEDIISLIASFN